MSNTPPWVSFTFFKLYKWYQIAQSVSCIVNIANIAELKLTFKCENWGRDFRKDGDFLREEGRIYSI